VASSRKLALSIGSVTLLLLITLVTLANFPVGFGLRTQLGVWAFNQSYDRLAAELFVVPADAGYAPAQNHLAVLRFDGNGTVRNRQDTIIYLRASALAGYAPAQVNLGQLYWNGINNRLARNWEKTRTLYEASATQGDPFGLSKLADFIMWTRPPGAYKKVVPLRRQAAKSGDAEMLYEFASHLHYICGRPPDHESCQLERMDAFRKAATEGHIEAQYELATLYEFSNSPLKPEEYIRLLRQSAEAGYIFSQDALAELYFKGVGVKRDRAEAARWYEKVAAFRPQKAKRPQAPPRGYDALYLRPFRGGRPGVFSRPDFAMLILAKMYVEGIDVPQNYEKAAYYFEQAAKRGDSAAALELAKLFLEGRGVPKSRNDAIYWLKRAEKGGISEAAVLLSRLTDK